uniref:Uncharacterized protein n=2 Tax=unclassified Caudoviricetes TaxID=2788787 RepID=A0A8S5QJ22_9CAUD|nr:MAG TPA: hypothetical protein [Myoviridae sp. ct0QB11]DAE19286.1 MAG TPA: hypothetical protein [Myoviridae sp. ctdXd38]
MLIVRKAKANLPVCTVYGYVCKLKFAMKFKILGGKYGNKKL